MRGKTRGRGRRAAYIRKRDLAGTFARGSHFGNRTFRALLGDRRISVYADPDRDFRVEEIFEVDLASAAEATETAGNRT